MYEQHFQNKEDEEEEEEWKKNEKKCSDKWSQAEYRKAYKKLTKITN